MKFSKVFFLFFSLSSFAASKFSLELAIENRFFLDDGNPITNGRNHSFQATPEFKFKEGVFRFMARGQSQYDLVDESKNYIYPEDLWIGLTFDDHAFKVGYQVLNWSTNEVFHPIDTINSRNFDTNIRNAGKIGELMASYKLLFGDSSFFAYFSPMVQKPFFTEETNQFGFGASLVDPFYTRQNGEITDDPFIPQFGLQFNTQISDIDISLNYLNQISRENPVIVPAFVSGNPEPVLTPILVPVQQAGLAIQAPLGSFVFKGQVAYKMFDEDLVNNQVYAQFNIPGSNPLFLKDYTQAAFGLERSFAFDEGDEASIFFEMQRYFGIDNLIVYSNTIFQADAVIGFRYSFNDEQSKEILSSLIFDYESFNQFILQINYSQRLFDSWKLSLGYQTVSAPKINDNVGANALENSDHGYLTLIKYF